MKPPLDVAAAGGEGPAREAVGNVHGVAGGAGEAVVEVGVVDGAAVVQTGGGIVRAAAGVAELGGGAGVGLLEAVAVGGAGGAVADHLDDLVLGAGVDAGAGAGAVVGLHEARVDDAVVRGGRAHAALALLHDDGQDEAAVDARLARDLLDGRVDAVDLVRRVVGAPAVPAAGLGHERRVGGPELVVAAPVHVRGPAGAGGTIALVGDVLVGDGEGVGDGAVVVGALDGEGGAEGGEGEDNGGKHFEGLVVVVFVVVKKRSGVRNWSFAGKLSLISF